MSDTLQQAIDLNTFHRDEQAGEYDVELHVSGTVRVTVKAQDAADARAQVEGMLDREEIDLFGSDIDDADVTYVRPCPTMYLVMRDGKEMGVSHVRPGDQPCTPTSEYMRSKYLPPVAKAEGRQ